MGVCKTLIRSSILSLEHQILRRKSPSFSSISLQSFRLLYISSSNICFVTPIFPKQGLRYDSSKVSSRLYGCSAREISDETTDTQMVETVREDFILEEPPEDLNKDMVERYLKTREDDIARLMKMERRSESGDGSDSHWFPYLDMFKVGNSFLTSSEILEVLDPLILDARKKRMRKVVENRSYSICLVVEGLMDFGNVSAVCRSADALGFQSIHVISSNNTKRYRDNRHVSMGAEKWLDIEVWDSTQECFNVLKSRGYRIATTHVGIDAVSIYDMDWSCPTAIVVGNESRGITEEALELSNLHCSIPMKGMVDSFNVSVAAGILMHQAVCDRTSRLGCHGDLTCKERQILLAEFSLRHSKSAISLAHEHAKRKADIGIPVAKL